jgi:hypothetical protein
MTDKTDFALHVVDDAHNSNPQESEVSATIQVISVETGRRMRDARLRSDDFFEVEKYPTIEFRTELRPTKDPEVWTVVVTSPFGVSRGRSSSRRPTSACGVTHGAAPAPASRGRPRDDMNPYLNLAQGDGFLWAADELRTDRRRARARADRCETNTVTQASGIRGNPWSRMVRHQGLVPEPAD